MPWRPGETKTARMICDIVTPDGEPYEGDPRYVLRRALERMRALGFETFNVGPELEYFLFRDDRGTETLDEGGYFAMTTMDAASELRQETVRALESMGIPIEYVHHEVGPSQHEIDMRFAPALDMADHTVTYRLIVKEIAKKAGFHASFMPKPIFGENGSGMHTHQSLFTDGRNAFFDADDEWSLSEPGKAFIAGQLRHAREIAAVFAQWVNSYKRLVPGYEAPVYVAWSRRNRSALIRIPLYKPGHEQATRAEIRCPRPRLQPVPHLRGALHAGLEGIERGYELPEPMETNLYHLTAEQRKERGIVALPETLGEAIDELADSELARKALGPHIFDRYIELKRKEWDDYRVQLTQWELDRYLRCGGPVPRVFRGGARVAGCRLRRRRWARWPRWVTTGPRSPRSSGRGSRTAMPRSRTTCPRGRTGMPRTSRRRGSWLAPAGRLRAGRRWRRPPPAVYRGVVWDSVYVHRDARGRGIGRLLLERLVRMPTAPGSGRSRRGSSPRTGQASRSISGAAFAWSAFRSGSVGRTVSGATWCCSSVGARRSASPACPSSPRRRSRSRSAAAGRCAHDPADHEAFAVGAPQPSNTDDREHDRDEDQHRAEVGGDVADADPVRILGEVLLVVDPLGADPHHQVGGQHPDDDRPEAEARERRHLAGVLLAPGGEQHAAATNSVPISRIAPRTWTKSGNSQSLGRMAATTVLMRPA